MTVAGARGGEWGDGVRRVVVLFIAITAAATAMAGEQRPTLSEPKLGLVASSRTRFGQSRPFNHFGRRRASPTAAVLAARGSGIGAILLRAVEQPASLPQHPSDPAITSSGRATAAAAVTSVKQTQSAGRLYPAPTAGTATSAATARVKQQSQRPAVEQNEALRSVESGSFVVASGALEDAASGLSSSPAALSSKINIESRLSTVVASGVLTETVRVGGTAILHCAFEERERPAAHKPPQIWWTKLPTRASEKAIVLASGSQVRLPDERLKVVTFPDGLFSILIVRAVVEQDAAEYKCSLPTVTGYRTAFTKLQVLESLESQVVSSEPLNYVKAGDDHVLFCKSKSGLPLNVWWSARTPDGRPMVVGGNGEDRVFGESLQLTEVGKDTQGVYTCNIENKDGAPIRKHFGVTLKERPWDVVAYQSGLRPDALLWQSAARTAPYGETVELRCDSGGLPKPTVRWLRNGVPQPELGPRHTVTSHDSAYKPNAVVSKFTIESFTPSDAGRYVCAVENDVGYSEYTFDLRARTPEANEI